MIYLFILYFIMNFIICIFITENTIYKNNEYHFKSLSIFNLLFHLFLVFGVISGIIIGNLYMFLRWKPFKGDK